MKKTLQVLGGLTLILLLAGSIAIVSVDEPLLTRTFTKLKLPEKYQTQVLEKRLMARKKLTLAIGNTQYRVRRIISILKNPPMFQNRQKVVIELPERDLSAPKQPPPEPVPEPVITEPEDSPEPDTLPEVVPNMVSEPIALTETPEETIAIPEEETAAESEAKPEEEPEAKPEIDNPQIEINTPSLETSPQKPAAPEPEKVTETPSEAPIKAPEVESISAPKKPKPVEDVVVPQPKPETKPETSSALELNPEELDPDLENTSSDGNLEYERGMAYYRGNGVPENFPLALRWFEKAASTSHATAQYYLGIMNYRGQGKPHDFQLSSKWFRQAAKQNHASAQYNLGFLYYKGEGVEKDIIKAFMWFDRAADNGNKKAITTREILTKVLPGEVVKQ